MNLKEEEKALEKKCELIQDKIIKDDILLVYNKINSKKISEYHINISFSTNNKQNQKKDNEFILDINITKKTMFLFCKNLNPISDGRDILPLISKESTNINNFVSIEDIKLLDIINNIQNFLKKEKFIDLDGNFYVGEEYNPKIINNLENIEKFECNHLDIINGKISYIPSLFAISDENICLFEKVQTNYCLVFYSNIKNLLSFNKSYNNALDSIVTSYWKKKLSSQGNEIKFCKFELKIESNKDEDMDKIMDILIEKIKNIGFTMDISEPKRGSLPDLNVEKTEGEIKRLENQLKNKDNILVFNKLLNRYEKIIEYLSAINDNRYTDYKAKMKELLGNEKYSKYLN